MYDNGLVDMHLHCTCAKVVILGPSIVDRSNLLHLESDNGQQQRYNQSHRCLPKHLPAIQVFRLRMFYLQGILLKVGSDIEFIGPDSLIGDRTDPEPI